MYIEIHCTVQMYNILRLTELIDWAEPYNFKIYFNILNHPDWLNIRVLPQPLKIRVEEMLKIEGIVDYMNVEDWSNLLDTFFEKTHKLDVSRTENLRQLIPELYEI